MIDDMTARRFSEATRRDYARHVRNFETFLGRSPDTASCEDLRRYQLHLAKERIGAASVNSAIAALRFFFNGCSPLRPSGFRSFTDIVQLVSGGFVL
jgi:site-specific recombinase XerD